MFAIIILYDNFANRVGWKKAGFFSNDQFDQFAHGAGLNKDEFFSRSYDEIKYNLNSPQGHLPVLPGVVPLGTINNIPKSIASLKGKSFRQYVMAFATPVLGVLIVSFAYTICEKILFDKFYFRARNREKYNNLMIGVKILICVLCIFIFLKMFHHVSKGIEFGKKHTYEKQYYLERINKNRPIAGSILYAGAEPLVFTLEKCNF